LKSSITIITAVFNGASTIGDCLRNINSQTVPTENIIIDGASTDNTIDIVQKLRSQARIISEPDQGIYDAMNKGLQLATGDIIGILNADDWYADDMVIERVRKVFEDPTVDACYGDLIYVKEIDCVGMHDFGEEKSIGGMEPKGQGYNQTRLVNHGPSYFKILRYWRSGPFSLSKFKWGWMPPHPTFFVRRRIYEQYGLFNLSLGSAADYELMLRFLFKHRIKVGYIPKVLVCMRDGGVSNASFHNRLKANRMDRKAWVVNELRPYPWTIAMKPVRKIPQYFLKPKNIMCFGSNSHK